MFRRLSTHAAFVRSIPITSLPGTNAAISIIGAATANLRKTNVIGSIPPPNPKDTTGKEVPQSAAAAAVAKTALFASLPNRNHASYSAVKGSRR